MYSVDDVRDIRSFASMFAEPVTLVTFNDGNQYCSCCRLEINPVDYHESYDEFSS